MTGHLAQPLQAAFPSGHHAHNGMSFKTSVFQDDLKFGSVKRNFLRELGRGWLMLCLLSEAHLGMATLWGGAGFLPLGCSRKRSLLSRTLPGGPLLHLSSFHAAPTSLNKARSHLALSLLPLLCSKM